MSRRARRSRQSFMPTGRLVTEAVPFLAVPDAAVLPFHRHHTRHSVLMEAQRLAQRLEGCVVAFRVGPLISPPTATRAVEAPGTSAQADGDDGSGTGTPAAAWRGYLNMLLHNHTLPPASATYAEAKAHAEAEAARTGGPWTVLTAMGQYKPRSAYGIATMPLLTVDTHGASTADATAAVPAEVTTLAPTSVS